MKYLERIKMSVHKKLNEARLALQNMSLKKTGLNKFAKYTYFELGDFLPTINTIFNDVGLCGVISFGTELATLTITETEGDGKIEITSPMKEANLKGCHPIQNLGAVETYTRRYLWVTAMEIVEHDALDSSKPLDDKVKPPKESAKSIAQDHWDKLSDEEKTFLSDIAMEAISAYEGKEIDKAHDLIFKNNLQAEEITALSSIFDSKMRRAIKEHQSNLRKEL